MIGYQRAFGPFLLSVCFGVAGLTHSLHAAEESKPAPQGMTACVKCHDETEEYPVLSILNTKHAVMADKNTPFADEACQTCHGKSPEHQEKPKEGEKRAYPTVTFKTKDKIRPDSPVSVQNEVCLKCHESGFRMQWKGSPHERDDIACSQCHTIHTDRDKVLHKGSQSEVCFDCHKQQRSQIHQFSSHPIKEGKMGCAACHNPHGSAGPKLLTKPTVNETCYTCHAEKRGPFLWEHPPARENCLNCHTPHGSRNKPLLDGRLPWLCQECHMENFHPSTAYRGLGVPASELASVESRMLANSCSNCHMPHGSNHPSGVRKLR